MKKNILILILLLAYGFAYGQTTLVPGDIAITGFNSDNPDEITFVLLRDISNTTSIKFTDNGWINSGSFRANEGIIEWTAASDLPCGTEIIITDNSPFSASTGNVTDSPLLQLSATGGDQILAYQGAEATPSFIYAINFDSTGWSDATTANTTAIPIGLSDGINAVNLGEIDNANYDCTSISGQGSILAGISASGNWNLNNTRIITIGGCSYSCGPCTNGTTTWNGTAWNNGIPDLTTEAVISGNYDTNINGSFSACTLTVNPGFNLNVNDGDYVEVENDVTVNGQLLVQTQGNFIQNSDAATFTDNSTNGVLMNKTKTVANKFVYTYWSSPVVNETVENVFDAVPVDKRFEFIAANFVDLEEEIGNTGTFLPNAGVDDIDDNGDAWNFASGALVPGVGYAMRTTTIGGPGGGFPRTETYPFIGAFNNGEVTIPLVNNSGGLYNDWNLIGNPYPSAIDADQFFAVNAGVVDAIYLWDQFTAPSETASGNEGFNFSGADYAMINGSGSVSGGASGTPPNRFVASGQGFFVEALSASNVVFNNSMRLITNDNSQFFKGKTSKNNTTNNADKLWVNLSSNNGAFNQILVSYIDGASNFNDGAFYDLKRPVSTGNKILLYSLIENDNEKFAIQGKASNSLNTDEIIKLGFKTSIEVATTYTLSIAQLQGDFLSSNTVYLKDNVADTIHNLSESDYNFTSEVGEFNDRFEIAFSTTALLSTTDFEFDTNAIKIVQLNDSNVQFIAETSTFAAIAIYDLLGRPLYSVSAQGNDNTYDLSNLKNSVYIANITLANGITVSKKFIKQ